MSGKLKKLPKNAKKVLETTKEQYKKPPLEFGNANKIRTDIALEVQNERKIRRLEDFENNRKAKGQQDSKVLRNENQMKLSKWRAQREKKQNQEKLQKKPPFWLGTVHHRICSPITSTNISIAVTRKKLPVKIHAEPDIERRITKATQKRLAQKTEEAKNLASFNSSNCSVPVKNFQESKDDKIEASVKNEKSFDPPNYKIKTPTSLTNMSLFGVISIEDMLDSENNLCKRDKATENLNADIASNNIETTLIELESSDKQQVSDCLQKKRSNPKKKLTFRETNNAEVSSTKEEMDNVEEIIMVFSDIDDDKDDTWGKEEKSNPNINQSLRSDKFSKSKNTGIKCSNVLKEEEEYTVQHFKNLLHVETERLRKLCEKWEKVRSQEDTREEIQHLISQATGQTTLLLKEKFEQFHKLVLDYENGGNENFPIKCTDLHGFWDLMYIEVKDCDSRFARLKELRANCWQEHEEKPTFTKSDSQTIAKKKEEVTQKKPKVLQDFILAEKRKQKAKRAREKKAIGATNKFLNLYMYGKCDVPSISKKKFIVHEKILSSSQSGSKFSESMYTSTPAHNNINTKTFHQTSSPFITMKISQLYSNKSMLQLDNIVQSMVANKTPKTGTIAKSGESEKSMSIRSTPRLWRDDSLISRTFEGTSPDKELARKISEKREIDRDAGSSSKKMDNANVSRPHLVKRAEEELIFHNSLEEDSTFKCFQSLNETATKVEDKNDNFALSLHNSNDSTLIEHISGRFWEDSKEESLVSSLKSQTTNENIKISPAIQSVINILSTPQIAKNFTPKKITLDQIDSSKNHRMNVKVLRNRSISLVDTPKSDRRNKSNIH